MTSNEWVEIHKELNRYLQEIAETRAGFFSKNKAQTEQRVASLINSAINYISSNNYIEELLLDGEYNEERIGHAYFYEDFKKEPFFFRDMNKLLMKIKVLINKLQDEEEFKEDK